MRKAIYFIDIDETLFRTHAKVGIKKDGELLRVITSEEYNTYNLQHGENYDFDEFKNADLFYTTSKPIQNVIDKVISIHDKVKTEQGSRMIVLTARSDFTNKEPFLEKFRAHNIDIDDMYIERAGNIDISTSLGKQSIIRQYLLDNEYTHVKMIDDFTGNLDRFLELQHEFYNTKFSAWQVNSNGDMIRYKDALP